MTSCFCWITSGGMPQLNRMTFLESHIDLTRLNNKALTHVNTKYHYLSRYAVGQTRCDVVSFN